MANKVIKKSASAGTFTISSDDKALKVSGQVDGGVFNIDGFAADFKVTVKGNTVTLTESDKDTALTSVTFTLKALKSATLKFVDGALTVTQTAEGVKVGTTLVGKGLLLSAATLDEANAYDPDGGSTSTSSTFTLTTDSNLVTGTSGNDTINGVIDDNTAANNTFTIIDSISGGLGNDTLSLIADVSGAGISLPAVEINGVETISIRNVSGQTFTASMAPVTGENTLVNNLSTAQTDFTNIKAGTTVKVNGNAVITNGATNAAYVAGATSGSLTVNGGVTAGAITITGADITAQTINSTGAANTTGAVTLAATTTAATINATTALTLGSLVGAGLTGLTVSGTGAVNLGTAGPASLTTVTATTTGGLTYVAGAVAEATDPALVDIADITINTGAGNDSINLSNVVTAREVAVNTGAGNDEITIGTVLVTSSATNAGDVVNGGSGTNTLTATGAVLADFTTALTTVSNIQVLKVSNALATAITPANIQAGLNTVTLAAGANAGTINFAAGASVVNIAASNAGQLTLNDTGTATSDSVTINNTATTADDMGDANALVVGGLETVNIVSTNGTGTESQDFGAITITADTGGTATLNLSGTNAVTAGAITAGVVNASGLTAKTTGVATFTMNAALVGGTTNTITGSAGDDTLVGDANDTTNITGGAGNDSITGGTDAETIRGGVGNDTINGGGGADIIFGDAGDDQITLAGTAETVDAGDGDDTVIAAGNLLFGAAKIGGNGNDTLSVNAAVSAANGSTVSGFEILTLATAGTTDLDNFNSTFTTVNLLAGAAQEVQSVRSQVIQLGAALTGDATVTLEDATGAANSATFKLSSAGAVNTTNEIVIAGVETINVISDDTNTTAHQNTIQLTVAAATTLNVSGDAGASFAGSANISSVTTMDASAVVLAAATDTGVTYTATYNTVGGTTTITGSNGVDALTGGANTNDTINGGAGADTLVYTGGTDVFTGGAGADIFDVNAISTSTGLRIADLSAGDSIDLAGLLGTAANVDYTAAAWAAQKVVLGGAATLTNYLDSAAAGTNAADEVVSWFNFGGNTYVVVDNTAATTFTAATDSVIVLTGTIDLSASSVLNGVLTVA